MNTIDMMDPEIKQKFTSWANARVKLHSQVHFGYKKVLGTKKFGVNKNLESNLDQTIF